MFLYEADLQQPLPLTRRASPLCQRAAPAVAMDLRLQPRPELALMVTRV